MYELFGAAEVGNTGVAEFKLFLPDAALDPLQYTGGGRPRIKSIRAIGTFQQQAWDPATGLVLSPQAFQSRGNLYTARTPATLAQGFYEYKYYVEFDAAAPRYVGDPCTKYAGKTNQNSGFVIDMHSDTIVRPIQGGRRPLRDLVIYELMIDDFTAAILNNRAPLEALADKIEHIAGLGVTAIELMPWTAWPNDDFNWGYEPFAYFAVAHRYTLDPADPTSKLVYLKSFINLCHDRGIAVIMDGVFNHAQKDPGTYGFGYYHLYQEPADCPYVGNFQSHDFATDLDYANGCTLEFILDVCKYWIDVFQIDGIRFDNTVGFYAQDDRSVGLTKLLSHLRDHLSTPGAGVAIDPQNFNCTLEHTWDYAAIDVVNKVGATSCWFYPLFWSANQDLTNRQIGRDLMRTLNASRDFGDNRTPTVFIENHDHSTLMVHAGSRDEWWRTQPWMIALFTSPGTPMLHNGQEWGQIEWFPEMGEENKFPGQRRVKSRPLNWTQSDDEIGKTLRDKYQFLAGLRAGHPGLRGPGFYPADWQSAALNDEGFGIDEARQLAVYHRYGPDGSGQTEYFCIALNFSQQDAATTLSFPFNGTWSDLLSNDRIQVTTNRYQVTVPKNWGRVYFAKQ